MSETAGATDQAHHNQEGRIGELVDREELHLHAGQKFAIITKGDIISLVPVPDLAEMRGIAKGADTGNYRDRRDRKERY